MINVRQAVEAARAYLGALYSSEEIAGILLEEVEFDENARCWFVTLSFTMDKLPYAGHTGVSAVVRSLEGPKRFFKVLKVHAETGEVLAMKIRAA